MASSSSSSASATSEGGGNNSGSGGTTKTTTNDKGIPEMEFINDVETFMKGKEVTPTLQALDESLQKYRFLEINLLQKRARLRRQLPDFEKSIEVIKLLESKKEINTHFLMSSQLYSKARIPPTDSVCLWLGANVMLEYPLDEAKALLEKNLNTSQNNLKQIEEDLEFLRDQITTSEVNLARIYNWNVKRLQVKSRQQPQQPPQKSQPSQQQQPSPVQTKH